MDNYENLLNDPTYKLPPDLQQLAAEVELRLRDSIDVVEGRILIRRQIPILHFVTAHGDVVLNSSDIVKFLEPLVRSKAFDSAEGAPRRKPPQISFTSESAKKILTFIELNFYELRAIVCKKNKKALSAKTTVGVAGLTHWLFQHFGVHEEFAKSTATAILVALLTATKGAFCKMTAEGAKTAMERLL
jgi:hypothetical protein